MFYNISCISTHQFSGQKLPPLNLACADLNVTSKITVGAQQKHPTPTSESVAGQKSPEEKASNRVNLVPNTG